MIIGFFLPPTIASQLALPEGESADVLHLTLAYLGDLTEETDKQRLIDFTEGFAGGRTAVQARVNGIARFTGNEGKSDAVVALIDSPDLPEFRQGLITALADSGIEVVLNHGFIPHVTLAYIEPDAPLAVVTIEPIEITFDAISLEMGDERHTFPMGEVERGIMSNLSKIWEQIKALVEKEAKTERAIKEVDSWDGSASNYTPEQYSDACLISVWKEAGKDEPTKDYCFLPVKEPGSNDYADKGIMTAAGGRGISRVKKPSDVPQEDWDKAVKAAANKIASLYKEMEMDVPASVEKMRSVTLYALEEMAYRAAYGKYPMASFNGLYASEDGGLFIVLNQDMKLYRSEIEWQDGEMMLSDWKEVSMEFVPRSQTTITRQADGSVRWLSISATATINKVGEIDSRQLFDNFVKRAEETGAYPQRIFYHENGQKYVTGQADFLARSGNCYITGGVYNDSFLAQAEIKAREAEPDYWGDSIGYLPMGPVEFIKVRGFDIPVYQDGINVEISTLPKNEAASLFVQTEVKRAMNERQLEALAKLAFGGDVERAKQWVEENPEEVNRQIDQRGLVTRSEGETIEVEVQAAEFELTDEVIQVIITRMAENEVIRAQAVKLDEQAQALTGLQEKLTSVETVLARLEQRLGTVEQTDQEKRRQIAQDLPANAVVTRLTYRPSVERGKEQAEQPSDAELAEKTLDGIGLKY